MPLFPNQVEIKMPARTPTMQIILSVTALAVGLGVCFLLRNNNRIVGFNFLGKSFNFGISLKQSDDIFSLSPYTQPVNEFLEAFIDSSQRTIRFSADDIKTDAVASPLLISIQGLDYRQILRRLRMISSLEPTGDEGPDEGIIRVVWRPPNGVRQEVPLKIEFAAKGQFISLSKSADGIESRHN